nr:unnamed protein product [Callosobruchus analis]
MILVEFLI